MAEKKQIAAQTAARKRTAAAGRKAPAKTGTKARRGAQAPVPKTPKAAMPRKTAQQAVKMAQETAKAATEAVKNLLPTGEKQKKASGKKTAGFRRSRLCLTPSFPLQRWATPLPEKNLSCKYHVFSIYYDNLWGRVSPLG